MHRLHLAHNLRTLALLLAVIAGITALVMLWWANHTGLPETWRAAIEQTVANQGFHIKIGGLRFSPFQGVIASEVRVYSSSDHTREISRLERLILDFDQPQLARGVVRLKKVELDHARLFWPIDPDNSSSKTLNITEANGTILMPGKGRFEARNVHGKIAGIEVALNANLIYQQNSQPSADDQAAGKRRILLAQIVKELEKWSFDRTHPPLVQISLEGDLSNSSSVNAKILLTANHVEKNDHRLDLVTADANLTGNLLTVSSIHATDSQGSLDAHVDYNVAQREGRFDIASSLEIQHLLNAWVGLPAFTKDFTAKSQRLEAEGDFRFNERNLLEARMTGHARCDSVRVKEIPFDHVETSISWSDEKLFLRDLHLVRSDGAATGKAMIEWPLVRLELHTTLPVPVYRPFFVGQPLEIVLNDFSERNGASVDVSLKGNFDINDHFAWEYTGSGSIRNLNYKGVPVNSANCKFTLNHHELDFYSGAVAFNYSKYPLREAFGGPETGTAKIGRIRYVDSSKSVQVEDIHGTIWAAPLIRFFAPAVADSLEQYRFHRPPELKGSGVVDVTPQGRTRLDVSFRSDDPIDYKFLGENITLGQPQGQVAIRGPKVGVHHLKLTAFDGPLNANLEYLGDDKLEGQIDWSNLSITNLATTYGFKVKGGGESNGKIDFSLTGGKVESMAGVGNVSIKSAELFSVPIFGPLTPLIGGVLGGVLNDESIGFQRAKDASFTFKIENGILKSNDFQTSTSSLKFVGDGSINLQAWTIDMNMRMNARGLLALLTLPLRPIAGLFQFHGSGPLSAPVWEATVFSPPPENLNGILQAPPKAVSPPQTE
ncbi:MAG: hypothetical protein ORN51_11785 [Akkermansiaceae bacterium]|nr:hypothetical protein [Akkermansiaceae bacterium]